MSGTVTDQQEIEFVWLRDEVTTLAEALDTSETGIDVTDGTKFTINDVILINAEQMLVTDIVTNTLTVTRAYNSSVAATHDTATNISVFKHRRVKLSQSLQGQAVDRFPGKVTIGDYSLDSNDLLSAWVISDLTGGHGIADKKEGVDDTRYRISNGIYTRYASQWTKSFNVAESTLGTGNVHLLGDLLYSGTVYRMAASGSTLYVNTTSEGAMGGGAVNYGVAFSGTDSVARFYVPCGTNGYSTYNPATDTRTNNTGTAAVRFQHFVKWDEKLIGINTDGTIRYAVTAADTTTFTAYTLGGNDLKLDVSETPIRLHTFFNRSGDLVVYVITDQAVWALDADTPRLYRVPDFNSVHPNFGAASAVWRGELYVASGMDILAFNGEVIRNVGLSRDDGLPYSFTGTGYVQRLVAGQNGLYAFVRSSSIDSAFMTSVHEWTGIGWHCIYARTDADAFFSAALSAAGAGYSLQWGLATNGQLFSMALPIAFTNPREAIDNSAASFGISWITPATNTFYLETGKFDANMKGYRKIANAVEMSVRTMPANNSIKLYYRIDNDTAWTQMYHTDSAAPSGQTVTTTGTHVFEFGPYDPFGKYTGIDFEAIEFRLEYVDTAANVTTPAVTSLVFSFLKIMNPSLAWTGVIDCRVGMNDASPETMEDELTELRTLRRFFTMKHRDTNYRVRLTGHSGSEESGQDTRGMYQISIIEVPSSLGVAHHV